MSNGESETQPGDDLSPSNQPSAAGTGSSAGGVVPPPTSTDPTEAQVELTLSGKGPRSPAEGKVYRSVTSEELLQGARELTIVHGGENYRLSVTRQGKLILQK